MLQKVISEAKAVRQMSVSRDDIDWYDAAGKVQRELCKENCVRMFTVPSPKNGWMTVTVVTGCSGTMKKFDKTLRRQLPKTTTLWQNDQISPS